MNDSQDANPSAPSVSASSAPVSTTAANEGRPAATSKLQDYLLENPGKAISIGTLTFGGLMLLVYFVRIGFMPDITLESATTLLYAVAMLGLFVLVVCALVLVFPGVVAVALLQDFKPQGRVTAKYALLVAVLCSSIGWGLTLAILFCWPGGTQWNVLIVGAGQAFAAAAWVWFAVRARKVAKVDKPVEEISATEAPHVVEPASVGWRVALVAAFEVFLTAFLLWSLLCVVLLLTIGFGQDGALRGADEWKGAVVLAVPVLVCSLLALFFQAADFGATLRRAVIAGPAVLLLVLVVSGSVTKPSAIAVGKLGAGEFEAARLVLTGKGCKQLNQAMGGVNCREVKDDEPTAVCPVTLRSRIGNQILIEFAPMALSKEGKLDWVDAAGDQSPTNPRRRAVLEKSALLAWSYPLPLQAAERAAAAASKVSVSGSAASASGSGKDELASQVYQRALNDKGTVPDPVRLALLVLCGQEPVKPESAASQPVQAPSAASQPAPAASQPAKPPKKPQPRPEPSAPICCCTAASQPTVANACPVTPLAER